MSDFKVKMLQIRFPLGLRPKRSPDPLAGFKGAATRQGGEGEGMGKGGEMMMMRMRRKGKRRDDGNERQERDGGGNGKGDRGDVRDGRGRQGKGGREEKGGEGLQLPKLIFLAPPLHEKASEHPLHI